MAEIVQQLANGVVVRLVDGTEVHCKPITLGSAIRFLDLWDVRLDEQRPAQERYQARVSMCREFFKSYPDLAERITMEDVDVLLPGFFWGASGATVPTAAEPAPTGTTPSAPTSLAPSAPPT
jgi:hypothetical protein